MTREVTTPLLCFHMALTTTSLAFASVHRERQGVTLWGSAARAEHIEWPRANLLPKMSVPALCGPIAPCPSRFLAPSNGGGLVLLPAAGVRVSVVDRSPTSHCRC